MSERETIRLRKRYRTLGQLRRAIARKIRVRLKGRDELRALCVRWHHTKRARRMLDALVVEMNRRGGLLLDGGDMAVGHNWWSV